MKSKVQRSTHGENMLYGNDTVGKVYLVGKKIIRKIQPKYFEQVQQIYRLYQKKELSKIGIVKTKIDKKNNQLVHEKHPISYPHEWSAPMFRDSLIFQLELLRDLLDYDLTLKDIIPQNVLFSATKPIMVDFISLIKPNDLSNERWLLDNMKKIPQDLRYLVIDKMFFPYYLIPLMAYAMGKRDLAQLLLRQKACNFGNGRPTVRDVFSWSDLVKPRSIVILIAYLQIKLLPRKQYSEYLNQLLHKIYAFPTPISSSNYQSYYKQKGEDYDLKPSVKWQAKQHGVYNTVLKFKPSSVLDIGTNTGWFALLAENLGAQVISTDIDHTLVSVLYNTAKVEKKSVLPLVLTYDDLVNPLSLNKLIKPALDRLQSELVMCLGLFHHLVLGLGNSQESVMKSLSHLTKKTLLLEFVDLADEKIQGEPSFFPNLSEYNPKTYSIENVKRIGKKYFTHVKILHSHPKTRTLLIFYNKKHSKA